MLQLFFLHFVCCKITFAWTVSMKIIGRKHRILSSDFVTADAKWCHNQPLCLPGLDHVNTVLEEEFGGVAILSVAAVVTDYCCVTFGVTLVDSCGMYLVSYSNRLKCFTKMWSASHLARYVNTWALVTFCMNCVRGAGLPSSCHAFDPAHRHRTTRASWVEATALLTSGKRPSQQLLTSTRATLSLFHFIGPDPARPAFDASWQVLTESLLCKTADELHPFAKGSQCSIQDFQQFLG